MCTLVDVMLHRFVTFCWRQCFSRLPRSISIRVCSENKKLKIVLFCKTVYYCIHITGYVVSYNLYLSVFYNIAFICSITMATTKARRQETEDQSPMMKRRLLASPGQFIAALALT